MTQEELITLLKEPESVQLAHQSDLKEMVEQYPYFGAAHILLAKSYQQSHSILFQASLRKAAVYSVNRRWLYYYMYPEKALSTEPYRRERAVQSTGDYFDLIQVAERTGDDTKQSLRNLADRLRSARELVSVPASRPLPKTSLAKNAPLLTTLEPKLPEEPVWIKPLMQPPSVKPLLEVPIEMPDDYFRTIAATEIKEESQPVTEENARKLIREKKYEEAIEILKQLNLINPKKSIYFADQIRFLEKVLVNSKK